MAPATANLTRSITVLSQRDGTFFACEPDGGDERGHTLTLDADVFEDMRRPDALTVTIQPGDLLNDGGVVVSAMSREELERVLGEAVGAASTCWANLEGAGVFDDAKARQVVADLMATLTA